MNLPPNTPVAYATYLARYIADPSTIRVRTLEQFGRAPTLARCRKLREDYLAERARRAAA